MATWDEFARLVRDEPSHYVENEDAGYIRVALPVAPYRRLHLTHQHIGGMDFIEVLISLGRPDTIDLFRAFESVSSKLCGLSHLMGDVAIKLVVPLRGFDLTDWRWPLAAMTVYIDEVHADACVPHGAR